MKKFKKLSVYGLSLLLGFGSLQTLASCSGSEISTSLTTDETPNSSTTSSTTSSNTSSSTSSSTSTGGFEETQLVDISWGEDSEIVEDTTMLSNNEDLYHLSAIATVDGKSCDVEITSDNDNIVEILEGNFLKVKGVVGQAVIRAHAIAAKDNKNDLTFTVTVLEYVQVEANIDKPTLTKGQTGQITVTNAPANSIVEYKATTNNVEVSSTGVVTPLLDGSDTITVSLYYQIGSLKLLVSSTTIEVYCALAEDPNVVLNNGNTNIALNVNEQKDVALSINNIASEDILDVTISGHEDYSTNFTYLVSDDYSKISMSLTADVSFTIIVTVSYNDKQGQPQQVQTQEYQITPVNTGTINFDTQQDTISMEYGSTLTLGVVGTLNSQEITSSDYSFEYDSTFIDIAPNGQITTKKDGTTQIKVYLNELPDVYDTVTLEIKPVYTFNCSTSDSTLFKDETLNLSFTATKNGVDDKGSVLVTFGTENILTYDSKTFSLTPVSAGNTSVTLTYHDYSTTINITVIEPIVIIHDLGTDNLSWTTENALTSAELLTHFTAYQNSEVYQDGELSLVFDENTKEALDAKTKGTYKVHAEVTVSGRLFKSNVVTIEVNEVIDEFTIYYYDKGGDYADLTSLWIWGTNNTEYFIKGVDTLQSLPDSYVFREEVYLDNTTGEETESDVDSIACLKFTLRTDVSYDIYTDWDGLTPKETKTISLNDVNSGVILRTEDGSKQTSDYNYSYSLMNEAKPSAYLYNNTTIYPLGKSSSRYYTSVYSGKELTTYETYVPTTMTSVDLRIKVDSVEKNGWVTGLYTFGQEATYTLVMGLESDVDNFMHCVISLTSETAVYAGWSNSGDTTNYTYQTIDFSKIILRDINGNVKTDDLTLDLVALNHAFDENGVLTISISLYDYNQGGGVNIGVQKIVIG